MRSMRGGSSRLIAWGGVLLIGIVSLASACGGEEAETGDRGVRDARTVTRLARAEFDVEGMTCGGCALATEVALKKLDGIARANARYDQGTGEGRCTVEYDPARVSLESMMAAIRDLGYEPTLLSAASEG